MRKPPKPTIWFGAYNGWGHLVLVRRRAADARRDAGAYWAGGWAKCRREGWHLEHVFIERASAGRPGSFPVPHQENTP